MRASLIEVGEESEAILGALEQVEKTLALYRISCRMRLPAD
jgi:hypothetical protein